MRLPALFAGTFVVLGLWGTCAPCSDLRKEAAASDRTASQHAQVAAFRKLLQLPETRIDLAEAKLAIDGAIDPRLDVGATLRQLDTLTAAIKARFPANATSQTKLQLLVTSLAQAGSWNDYRPFSYDRVLPR
jgi:hypothetical protein